MKNKAFAYLAIITFILSLCCLVVYLLTDRAPLMYGGQLLIFAGCLLTLIYVILYGRQKNMKAPDGMSTKVKKNISGCGIASFILGLVPIVLVVYCACVSGSSLSENGAGAVWWLVAFYYMTVGIPIFVAWITCGIIGVKTKKSKIAIASLIMKPAFLLLLYIIYLISRSF